MRTILNFRAIIVILYLLISTKILPAQENKDNADDAQKADSIKAEEESPKFLFNISPSLGFTYFNSSKEAETSEHVQWLAKLQSRSSYEGKLFQFNSTFLAQYGQIHLYKKVPEKFMDDIILTLTPSITVIQNPSIRVFLETSAESDIGDGI